MAKRFAERIAVHLILLLKWFGRVVFLPEGDSAEMQHPAPIGFDFLQNLFQITETAKGFQLIKTKVGSFDGRNGRIEQYRRCEKLFAGFICQVEYDGKNVGMTCNMPSAGQKGIYISLFFLVPEKTVNLFQKLIFIPPPVFRSSGPPDKRGKSP